MQERSAGLEKDYLQQHPWIGQHLRLAGLEHGAASRLLEIPLPQKLSQTCIIMSRSCSYAMILHTSSSRRLLLEIRAAAVAGLCQDVTLQMHRNRQGDVGTLRINEGC